MSLQTDYKSVCPITEAEIIRLSATRTRKENVLLDNEFTLHDYQTDARLYHPDLAVVKDTIALEKQKPEPIPTWTVVENESASYSAVLELLAKRQQKFFMEANAKLDADHHRVRTSSSIF